MLNIPSSVIALFKQDGVHKNFRVHFPNGELADLTNDNIVQESVKFTESVCSQDVFKFGLTEASTIEFESVGVANMYGMTIECSCEIDCSSLSAADKATIAAGTWDGTWDGVNAVFSVPYGTFRVESCPRDHQAMTHRKVTAYTDARVKDNPIELAKMRASIYKKFHSPLYYAVDKPNGSFAYDLDLLLREVIAFNNPDALSDMTATEKSLGYGTADLLPYPRWSKTVEGQTWSIEARRMGWSWLIDPYSLDRGTIISAEIGDFMDAGDFYDSSVTDVMAEEFAPFKDEIVEWLKSYVMLSEVYFSSFEPSGNYHFTGSLNALYPAWASKVILLIPKDLYLYMSTPNYNGSSQTLTIIDGSPTAYKHERTGSGVFPTIEILPTAEGGSSGNKWFSYADCYDVMDAVNGYLEISAQFATASRTAGNKLLRIDNTSPVSIIPGEYSQMWFDEYDVEPIGTIRYSYTDEAGEEQIVDYVFGSGASVYDMTDNAVLKLMEGADPATIEAMLDASFIPYIGAVNFVPIDLAMKGLPYIEAGDALSVTAQDGTVCDSFALRHEISGIQALEAQIDSESGLIIDSGEGS